MSDSGEKKKGGLGIIFWIVVGIVTGVIFGGFFPDWAVHFEILGHIFLNMLMMIVVPLVILSMIVGITGIGDIRQVGAIGWRTLAFFLGSTMLAVLVGGLMVNIFKPGVGISTGEKHPEFAYTVGGEHNRTVTLVDGTWNKKHYSDKYVLVLQDQNVQGVIEEVASNSISVSLWERREVGDIFYLEAEDGTKLPFRRVAGQLVSEEPAVNTSGTGVAIALPVNQAVAGKEGGIADTLKQVVVGNKETGKEGLIPRNIFNAMVNMEILPLIVFSLLLGAALSMLGKRGLYAIEIITLLNDAIMKVVHWIMSFAPIGIFGLIAPRIGLAGGFNGFLPELMAVGKYSLTVFLALCVHGFIVLPLLLWILGKRNPWKFMIGVASALLNAFSTASSSATLPITMESVEENNGVSNRTASFVLPLGATINMNGTALYEAVAAMFIAQMYNQSQDLLSQAVIFLTASLAAIGAAGIPEAGLVTMVIVLKAVNLPVEGVGLILSIDWLLDRFRTLINVWSDAVGAGIIDTMERKQHVAKDKAEGESSSEEGV